MNFIIEISKTNDFHPTILFQSENREEALTYLFKRVEHVKQEGFLLTEHWPDQPCFIFNNEAISLAMCQGFASDISREVN